MTVIFLVFLKQYIGAKTLITMMRSSGETQTYYWNVNKNTGPTAEQEDCSVSVYHSTVDVVKVC